jgi:nucleotide-binding universal stress UspA family protein
MQTLKYILVPTDFSDISREAFPYALMMAHAYGADVTLLHAITLYQYDPNNPDMDFGVFEDTYKSLEVSANSEANSMVDSVTGEHKKIRVTAVTERGVSAHETITAYTKEHAVDLIVMATHGRSGLKHLLIGSVTERVVLHAPCPVLVIRKPAHHDIASLALKTILVPTDFSESSARAMRHAITAARMFGADITVMHIVEIRFHPAYYAGGAESIFDLDPEIKGRIEARLESYLKGFDLDGINVHTIVKDGSAHAEIVKTAAEKSFDLIVMSTRGHDEIADYLIGSTTDRVIKRTPCPVLVTR